ncbi:MAG: CBS domain-containing protein, partial [Gammaproteobacteria bacterium]
RPSCKYARIIRRCEVVRMNVRDICHRQVSTLARGDNALDAARLMRDEHVGCVVVVDAGAAGPVPVGVVTDRDIVVAVTALDLAPEEVTLADIMGAELHVIKHDDGLSDALEVMRTRGIRRLPVIDDDGVLDGIVSADDILAMLADEVSSLASLVAREQRRERERRRIKV